VAAWRREEEKQGEKKKPKEEISIFQVAFNIKTSVVL
jgi:hypothetical protein